MLYYNTNKAQQTTAFSRYCQEGTPDRRACRQARRQSKQKIRQSGLQKINSLALFI